MDEVAQRRKELRKAVVDLRDRGLVQAAKWAAEQLVGLPEITKSAESNLMQASGRVEGKTNGDGNAIESSSQLSVHLAETRDEREAGGEEPEDEDLLLLGKSLFDLREYRRAAHAMQSLRGHKSFFLRNYATYLAGEKRKEEEIVELSGPLGRSDCVNEDLPALERLMEGPYREGTLDAFGTYLYGLVLHEREKKEEAREALCASVNEYPWNWSAWLRLQALCTDSASLEALGPMLQQHWMRSFFEASVLLDQQKNSEGLTRYYSLKKLFPRSQHVVAAMATAQYNLRDFDEAEAMFEELLRMDPFRMDSMDTYSNILYVKECFVPLSYLAHKAILTDKYRPDTCCIVGNYYSLKGQHEKAVLYFKRALRLNRGYLSAWTLMGHEFVEMKNTPAAIDAYRRAVDINPRDYRAWYGLGQTYEILGMPYYALYYYRQATQLREGDARMWCAMGQCYESEQLNLPEAAIRCYQRAHACNDREGIALAKLAKLHASLTQETLAAYYYQLNLRRMDAARIEGQDLIDALQFLANHNKGLGQLLQAERFATRLLDFGGPAKEDAKALLREIRSVQQHVSLSPMMDVEPYTP